MSQRFLFAVVVGSFVFLSDFAAERPKSNSAQAAEQNKPHAAAPQVHSSMGFSGNARTSSPNVIIKNGVRMRVPPPGTLAAHATNAVLKGAVQASSSKVQQQLAASGNLHHWHHHHWNWGNYNYLPASTSSTVVGVPNGNTLMVSNGAGLASNVGLAGVNTLTGSHTTRSGRVVQNGVGAGLAVPLTGGFGNAGNAVPVRLAGVASPAGGQAFFSESQQHLAAMALGKQVRVFRTGVDSTGAIVGQVFLAGSGANLNERQLRDGMAFHSVNNGLSPSLAAAEEAALMAHAGLWKGQHPVAPWLLTP
jgi:endonuclease YncB( thermonuclease family)